MKLQPILFSILIYFLFQSCVDRELEKKFEQVLGKENTEVLNRLVGFYEDFIDEHYQGKNSKSKRTLNFLKDVSLGTAPIPEFETATVCEILKLHESTTLPQKSEHFNYLQVKEVIDGTEMLMLVEQDGTKSYLSLGKEHFTTKSKGDKMLLYLRDSLIDEITRNKEELLIPESISVMPNGSSVEQEIVNLIKSGYSKHVSDSKYLEALNSIDWQPKRNSLFEMDEYLMFRKNVGSYLPKKLSNSLFAKYEDSDVHLDDYFLKRVIVVEIFLRYLENQSDC